jgi:hypothetical protein
MTPVQANEFMAALRAGRTLRRIASGQKRFGPVIASMQKYRTHCELYPEWGAETRRLAAVNAKAADALKGEHQRKLTHCKHGHPLAGENLFRTREGWRRCRICVEKSHDENRTMSEDQARQVVTSLNDGGTISAVTASGKPTYIVNHRALQLFRKKPPRFDRLVMRLSTANAKVHRLEATARRFQIVRAPAIAEQGADIFSLIRSAVPDYFRHRYATM